MAKKGVLKIKQTFVPAALWKRAFAYIIDALIVSLIVGFPFRSVLAFDQPQSIGALYKYFVNNPAFSTTFILVSLLTALLTILYWAIFEYKFKQSLGKVALRLHVHSTMKDLSFRQCFIRSLSKMSTLLLVIDCLPFFTHKTHQRYLEKLSNTEVVEMGWKL